MGKVGSIPTSLTRRWKDLGQVLTYQGEGPISLGKYDCKFLARLPRAELHTALWYCRRQDARPYEANPAAAQYDGLATSSSVRAEYRRRGWRVPKITRSEQA